MTAQISDTFLFKGERYELIGIKGSELSHPEQFGMEPEMMHTACYRGFYATYELSDKGLTLREMSLNEKNENYLPIEGVTPVVDDYEVTYRNLDVTVHFTGKIRLAREFLDESQIDEVDEASIPGYAP